MSSSMPNTMAAQGSGANDLGGGFRKSWSPTSNVARETSRWRAEIFISSLLTALAFGTFLTNSLTRFGQHRIACCSRSRTPPGRLSTTDPRADFDLCNRLWRRVFSDYENDSHAPASSFFLDRFATGISFPPVVQSRQHCGRKNCGDTRDHNGRRIVTDSVDPGVHALAAGSRHLWSSKGVEEILTTYP
jgi:hypothetical protein